LHVEAVITRFSLNPRATIILARRVLSRRQTGHPKHKEEQDAGE
jgi:hypothetical protein